MELPETISCRSVKQSRTLINTDDFIQAFKFEKNSFQVSKSFSSHVSLPARVGKIIFTNNMSETMVKPKELSREVAFQDVISSPNGISPSILFSVK